MSMNPERLAIVLGLAAAGGACNSIFHIPEATPGNPDVDECAMASSCAPGATCTNTPGSFTCTCAEGLVGDGTTRCVPAAFTKIVAGAGSTCAIAEDGTLWCWGSNEFGQLGDGTRTSRA